MRGVVGCMLVVLFALTVSAAPGMAQDLPPPAHHGHGQSDVQSPEEKLLTQRRQRRVECDIVVSEANRQQTAEHGKTVNASVLARRLHTNPQWVARCLVAYGRSMQRTGDQTADEIMDRLEKFEEEEPDEASTEDADENGAAIGSRSKQHTGPHREKERINRARPTPRAY